MAKVTTNRDWREVDELEGIPLKSGEWLEVTWPDSSKETLQVKTKDWSISIEDVGEMFKIPHSEAYAEHRYHGAYAWIRLAGHEARRVNV